MSTQELDDRRLIRAALPHVVVDDSVVVFDPVREQAHLLNHSAASVWAAFHDPITTPTVASALADQYGIDIDVLQPDVEDAVRDLRAASLLVEADGDETEVAAPSTAPGGGATSEEHGVERVWSCVSAEHRALQVTFRIEAVDEAIGSFLERVLTPLAVTPPATQRHATHASWTYRVWSTEDDPERFVVATEHESLTVSAARADAISTLLWHYNHDAIEHTHDLLLFHSSAVANGGGVLALPAVANSGKSTLATLLVRHGYRYLTDEALAVDPDTLLVHPYPKPIGLDPGSFPLFPDLEPTDEEQPPELFHHKWWLDPRRISPHGDLAVPAEAVPLQAVVFPTYDAEAEPSIEPVEPAEGVVLLARNTFNLKRWGQRGLDVLAAIATSVPLYTMTHNDLDATLQLLGDVIGPPPEPESDATA